MCLDVIQAEVMRDGLDWITRYRCCPWFNQEDRGGRSGALRRCYQVMLVSPRYSLAMIETIWTRAVELHLIDETDHIRSKMQ